MNMNNLCGSKENTNLITWISVFIGLLGVINLSFSLTCLPWGLALLFCDIHALFLSRCILSELIMLTNSFSNYYKNKQNIWGHKFMPLYSSDITEFIIGSADQNGINMNWLQCLSQVCHGFWLQGGCNGTAKPIWFQQMVTVWLSHRSSENTFF